MRSLQKKVLGYIEWSKYQWRLFNQQMEFRKKRNAFEDWLKSLKQRPPRVMLGAYFSEFGGIKHHLEAIVRNSVHKVELVPSPLLSKQLIPYDLTNVFNEEFMNFSAPGVATVHSQVFPWFINWCREKKRCGKTWVHTYHLNYYAEHNATGVLEPWQIEVNHAALHTVREADIRISTSRWMQEELKSLHGIDSVYIPNAVDINICNLGNKRRFESKFGCSEFILYVGRDDPIKNPGEFAQLAAQMPSYHFVMAGHGITKETLSSKYGIETSENLQIIGGLDQVGTQDAIAACSALVVTSKREGLPMLVMEAMTHGKPIVVSNDLGCREVVGEGEAGLIYELGNIESLKLAVEKTIRSPQIGRIARQRVEKEYAWEKIKNHLDEIY